MTKICEYCKCEFETKHGEVRFCSVQCAGMARRKRNFEKREARAAELGITVEELLKRSHSRKNHIKIDQGRHYTSKMKRPKTYKEIQAENRRRPIVAGWRGAPVMGGGSVHHNDPYLKPSEYVRFARRGA